MGNFVKDLQTGREAEREAILWLSRHAGFSKEVEYNLCNTKEYDIEAHVNGDPVYTFEVKHDKLCSSTGNLAIEFSCRGKPSGIEVTQASYWLIKIATPWKNPWWSLIETDTLRHMIKEKMYKRIVTDGGDVGSRTQFFLFSLAIFVNHSDVTLEG